jgi:integrase
MESRPAEGVDMASIYLRGQVWWGKWSQDGRVVRQSLGTGDRREARRVLKERMRQTVKGEHPDIPTGTKVTWDTAAADLLAYYQTYGTRNPREAGSRLKQLSLYFKGRELASIEASAILGYVAYRQRRGNAANTINLHLTTLGRALRLAQEYGKLATVPRIRMLKPAAPRSGFFEREEFEAVCRHLPLDLVLVVRISHTYGWRVNSEVLTLTKGQVDLEAGTLRLAPGSTKNRDGRVVYLTDELKAGLEDQLARVQALEREMGQVVPYVFPVTQGRHQGGPRRDIRNIWRRACRDAGLPGKLKHDLRRTAARNMINLGVPERVAMAVLGHKTRSMLDRYHIVSPGDLQDVARKLSHRGRTNLGTAAD